MKSAISALTPQPWLKTSLHNELTAHFSTCDAFVHRHPLKPLRHEHNSDPTLTSTAWQRMVEKSDKVLAFAAAAILNKMRMTP